MFSDGVVAFSGHWLCFLSLGRVFRGRGCVFWSLVVFSEPLVVFSEGAVVFSGHWLCFLSIWSCFLRVWLCFPEVWLCFWSSGCVSGPLVVFSEDMVVFLMTRMRF